MGIELSVFANHEVGRVTFNEPLARHNSWRIGGTADLFVEPESPEQLAVLMKCCHEQALPLVVIGRGTNLLFDDRGVRGVVVKIGERMAAIRIDGSRVLAQGGAWVPRLARRCMLAGLSGLEHCIGIPGTIGGLVIMNGGSQRRGIGENIVGVTTVNRTGAVETFSRAACRFAYRQSALQGSGHVVAAVELSCPPGDPAAIRRAMLLDLRARREKFPLKQPNCGSVFLSTEAMHASVGPPGKVIEDCGLKGLRHGRVEVSRQHANFIVNLGGATAHDVLELIETIRAEVRRRIGFDLRCEVRYVSPEGETLPAHLKLP